MIYLYAIGKKPVSSGHQGTQVPSINRRFSRRGSGTDLKFVQVSEVGGFRGGPRMSRPKLVGWKEATKPRDCCLHSVSLSEAGYETLISGVRWGGGGELISQKLRYYLVWLGSNLMQI